MFVKMGEIVSVMTIQGYSEIQSTKNHVKKIDLGFFPSSFVNIRVFKHFNTITFLNVV